MGFFGARRPFSIARAGTALGGALLGAAGALASEPLPWHEFMYEQTVLEGARPTSCVLTEPVPGSGSCERAVSERVQDIAAYSEILLNSRIEYRASSAGDGENGLVGRPVSTPFISCTSAMEAVTPHAQHDLPGGRVCRSDVPSRYFPGMENTFFGRAHFYETQWRPNVLNRGLAMDVTECVAPARRHTCGGKVGTEYGRYQFRMDAQDWDGVMERNLGDSPAGRLFLSHWRDRAAARAYAEGIGTENCAEAYGLFAAATRDWPYAAQELPAGLRNADEACASEASRRALGARYLALVDAIAVETRANLQAHPVETALPCIGFGSGKDAFDPERDLPAHWRHEGVVLFAALVRRDPKWTRNRLAVEHQGLVVFHNGKWVFRHASRVKGRFVEVPFRDYIRSNSFVGMNLLAP